ncbi:MAG: hypothetical protein ABI068_05110 [Ktedonobacterales bacterium]
MAQHPLPDEADQAFDGASDASSDPFSVSEFTRWAAYAEQLAQEGVRRELAADLTAGRSIYYGE